MRDVVIHRSCRTWTDVWLRDAARSIHLQICPSLTCFIMECRAIEGKLYFLSIMFKTWQSLEGNKNKKKSECNREM